MHYNEQYYTAAGVKTCSAILRVCSVMSRDQNGGRMHSVRNDNSTFERVEEFKYLGTTLTKQSAIQVEIKSRMR